MSSESVFDYKQRVAQSFGEASATYADQATAQRACAQRLLELFGRYSTSLSAGPILELGCGTGFLTQGLIAQFSDTHPLEVTDLSPAMVAECQQQMQQQMQQQFSRADCLQQELPATVRFQVLDGEAVPPQAGPYALITSNFALQWFQTPEQSLKRLWQTVMPGGWLLLSFPSCRSFPQWRSHCEALNLPFPAGHLPDAETLLASLQTLVSERGSEGNAYGAELEAIQHELHWQDHWLPLHFDNALAFLRHFKAIGAQNRLSEDQKHSSPTSRQFRQLITRWNQQSPNGVVEQYHAVCIAMRKGPQKGSVDNEETRGA